MRRRAGVGAIQRDKQTQLRYSEKKAALEDNQLQQLASQMDIFKLHLQKFAARHKQEIKQDPHFRKQFQEMCAAIGVDPLASSKGFWQQLLGVGDYYYELSVRVVETCMAATPTTGGLLPLEQLQRRLAPTPSLDDLRRAINKLKVLGAGFQLVELGDGEQLVQSVPGELSKDQAVLLESARIADGRYCPGQLEGWSVAREQMALQSLIRDQMVWLDEQSQPPDYWIPSLWRRSGLESAFGS